MSDKDESKHESQKSPVSARRAKKLRHLSEFLLKQESRNNSIKVSRILKKLEHERTETEKEHLVKHDDIVRRIRKNKERRQISAQRTQELEDSEEILQRKCEQLADIIQRSRKTVIYTGAGISTAASIPDYRGPQGVWTLLKKGEQIDPQDLSDAEPTFTHMCITHLHQQGHVKHVVSQNCDGLHLRSGLPRQVLSEVHGNMFLEICYKCRPHREYIRLFDVTENTGVRRHVTGRKCSRCRGDLKDTIVHFGERGGLNSPYRWKEAVKAANKCDLILCLGSSLKILKRYACLWCMDRAKNKRPKLVIVNLQWTPKDEAATIKINGKCDDVLQRVMSCLSYTVPQYARVEDPLFLLATPLAEKECSSTTKKVLERPESVTSKNKYGLSRSPTPSDSDSDTSCAEDSSSTETMDMSDDDDKCEIREKLKNEKSDDNPVSAYHESAESDAVSKSASNVKQEVKDKTEAYMTKSERICNEAKLAMQTKLVNARINEMCSTSEQNGVWNKTAMLSQSHFVSDINQVHVNDPHVVFDPLRAGSFDPGPENYNEKVAYLHALQAQLEVLKQKQKSLKEQELCGKKARKQTLGPEKKEIKTDKLAAVNVINNHTLEKGKQTVDIKPSICDRSVIEAEIAKCKKNIEKLQQEKNELDRQKSKVAWDFSELEHHVQKRHQNDQLRLHQHFLIQEQLLTQVADSQAKKDNLLKQFLYQQQLLISQQNVQLQEIRHNHVKEIQELDISVGKKNAEILNENCKLADFQRRLVSPQVGSPTKTDHSIMSILKHEESSDSKPETVTTESPGLDITCDSCRFLKDYGVVKRKCQNCQLLRAKYIASQKHILVKSTNVASETYSNNLNNVVEKLSMRCKNERTCDSNSNNGKSRGKATVSISSASKVSSPPLPQKESTSILASPAQGTLNKTNPPVNIPSVTVQVTSGEGPTLTCREPSQPRVIFSLASDEDVEENKDKTLADAEGGNIGKVKDKTPEKNVTIGNKVDKNEKLVECQKPTRSHSQSEIYSKKVATEETDEAGSRYIRSHSHTEGTSSGVSDLELTPSKSEGNLETTQEGSSSGKKRKVARCLSVPGWFGKGLNIKKKRR